MLIKLGNQEKQEYLETAKDEGSKEWTSSLLINYVGKFAANFS
jgi:hypothetical protein